MFVVFFELEKCFREVLEEEIQARKRVVLNKMSDCLRSIENAVSQINIVSKSG